MRFGIKDPAIEKREKVEKFALDKKIGDFYFLNSDQILESYKGAFPKVFIFNKDGELVIRHNCYELIEENLVGLLDSIPEKTSSDMNRQLFLNENVSQLASDINGFDEYDYTVFFYWSVWLGDFNVKKMKTAKRVTDLLNQKNNRTAIMLVPINFDFIEDSGWTKEEVENGLRAVLKKQG